MSGAVADAANLCMGAPALSVHLLPASLCRQS